MHKPLFNVMNILKFIILGLILISCNTNEVKMILPIVKDSIPRTESIISTKQMLEGGYTLIGFAKRGEDFEIKHLDKKHKEYLLKYVLFLDSIENNKTLESEELLKIVELPNSVSPPSTPNVVEPIYVENNNLNIYVDTTQILNIPDYTDNLLVQEKMKASNNVLEYSDLSKESLSKYYSYSEKFKQAYPLFVYNKTDSIIPIDTKEGWVCMIQEAKDQTGEWKPIEYYDPHSFCGNSFGTSSLLPNHFMISKIYKYSGAYKTKIRVKFTTNSNVYYSNEFMGEINIEQFEMPSLLAKTPVDKRHYYFLRN